MTRYQDAASGLDLQLQSGGAAAVGTAGLGSELDRAWNGKAWVQVGQGGALQADRIPDAFYTWSFTAADGDIYYGYLVGHAPRWEPGDSWSNGNGTYRIHAEQSWGGDAAANGSVWTVGYYDAASQGWLSTWSWGTAGGYVISRGGLGTEYDWAWDGDNWDLFGWGGAAKADVEMQFVYTFVFTSRTGDMWYGWLYDDSTRFSLGQRIDTGYGEYAIVATARSGGGVADGSVYVAAYYDAQANTWLQAYAASVLGQPAGWSGLGTEFDRAWDGLEWDDFGWSGFVLSDLGGDSVYGWYFQADSGDLWGGWLYEDSARYAPGQSFRAAGGTYHITSEVEYGRNIGVADGTAYASYYWDAAAQRWLSTWSWSQAGAPASAYGLGAELDYAWTGTGWAAYGYGGAFQANAA